MRFSSYFIYLLCLLVVTAYPSGLEGRVHNVGVRVHGVLHDLRSVGRRHPSAVGQSVQRPDELGAQEEQEEEEEGQGHRGHRSMSSPHPPPQNPIAVRPPPQSLPPTPIKPSQR